MVKLIERDGDGIFFASTLTLHNSLPNSDCLFFVRYIPENTVKANWFLVQINHAETLTLEMDSKTTGDYHVTFLSRHPDDGKLCDDKARWWPLWYEHANNSDDFPLYGARILLGPKRKPDPDKYILWSDSVDLTDTSCFYMDLLILKLTPTLSQPSSMSH